MDIIANKYHVRSAVWGVAYSAIALCQAGPLYYFVSILSGVCTLTTSRPIPVEVAQAIIPAVCLGAIIPHILFFLPFDTDVRQNIVALWQANHVYCTMFTAGIAALIRFIQKQRSTAGDQKSEAEKLLEEDMKQYKNSDVAPLKSAYTFLFSLLSVVHIATLFFISNRSDLTFSDVFCNLPDLLTEWDTSNMPLLYFNIWKYDMWVFGIAQLVYCIYIILELRSEYYNHTPQCYLG